MHAHTHLAVHGAPLQPHAFALLEPGFEHALLHRCEGGQQQMTQADRTRSQVQRKKESALWGIERAKAMHIMSEIGIKYTTNFNPNTPNTSHSRLLSIHKEEVST